MTWKEYIKNNTSRFLAFLLLFVLTLVFVYKTLLYVENREGSVLYDPLLSLFNAFNVSVPLFLLTYSGTLIGVIYAIRNPLLAIETAVTYMFILWLRMLCMYLTPLNPPDGIIPLRDFILEATFYSGQVNVKDLFFSGHTASMFLFFIIAKNKKIKYLFAIYTIFVASLVLIQHAHYTIDVLVAPIMVYFSHQLALKFMGLFIKQ